MSPKCEKRERHGHSRFKEGRTELVDHVHWYFDRFPGQQIQCCRISIDDVFIGILVIGGCDEAETSCRETVIESEL